MKRSWKIIATGEGGQGVQSLADILALAAFRSGRQSLYIPNFGIEQRGGVSLAMIQIDDVQIGSPKFLTADLIAALSPRSLERCHRYIGPVTLLLYDNSLIESPAIADQVVGLQSYDTIAPEAFAERTGYRVKSTIPKQPAGRAIAIAAADLARKQLHPRVFNMIILGAIVGLTGAVELKWVKRALEEKLDRRFAADPGLRENNFKALEMGFAQAQPTRAAT